VIDLRSDERLGLLSFKPTPGDHLRLAVRTLHEGVRVLLKHPRLLGLFLEAAATFFSTGSVHEHCHQRLIQTK
jgi:hypothetical protein